MTASWKMRVSPWLMTLAYALAPVGIKASVKGSPPSQLAPITSVASWFKYSLTKTNSKHPNFPVEFLALISAIATAPLAK